VLVKGNRLIVDGVYPHEWRGGSRAVTDPFCKGGGGERGGRPVDAILAGLSASGAPRCLHPGTDHDMKRQAVPCPSVVRMLKMRPDVGGSKTPSGPKRLLPVLYAAPASGGDYPPRHESTADIPPRAPSEWRRSGRG